ncbi:eukaryotic translation initiation factor 4E-1 [Galendromus occidentalis]|uniref:eIF-4F 25 kDa subunit n=1 Tax=Galendromus occidentalis TaxID=34638 RepID=A0AAJ6QPD9_9ACAR|nr:eukaryotic translation initiation factor 4E-1 [Galendromus occidentalis]
MGILMKSSSEAPEEAERSSINHVHPAQTYTLWYNLKQNTGPWSDSLLEIATGTAIEILEELNAFGLPSSPGQPRGDLCIFRSHIVPMWEDPLQIRGGRWTVDLKKPQVDIAWYRSVMAWFRAKESEWSAVTGIYLMIRGRARIALWFADGADTSDIKNIRNYWSEVIGSDLTSNASCNMHQPAA